MDLGGMDLGGMDLGGMDLGGMDLGAADLPAAQGSDGTQRPEGDSSAAPAPGAQPAVLPYDNPRDFGYVFVMLGNLKEIACDTWLGAAGASLDARLIKNFPPDAVEITVSLYNEDLLPRKKGRPPPRRSLNEEVCGRMFTYEPWPGHRPKPYTINLSKKHFGESENYIAEIERYIRIAARDCYRRWPNGKLRKNVCPLIATSLLGTGYGGNYRKTGGMVKRLLPRLYSLADELRVDIAIVTIEEEVFALTNSLKKQFLDLQTSDSDLYKTISGSRYLNEQALNKLRFLAAQAMRGELTLFVGAGASMGAGIPSWANLLNTIAAKLGIQGEDFREFSSLDYYTKAAVLESRLKRRNDETSAKNAECSETETANKHDPSRKASKFGFGPYFDAVDDYVTGRVSHPRDEKKGSVPEYPRTLGQFVARETQSQYYSIVDAVLASLPCKEIITTNYDDLLETAWSYSGPYSVLPYLPIQGCKRWILKMHGTVTHPDEIVLSKRDYMRYHDRFAAMAGIVQSTLLTRHLLFVGFSLDDDNFQRIFDSVRKARRPTVEDCDLENPTSESYQRTQLRQKRMSDKANKFIGGKAKYPMYAPNNSEEDEVCEFSDVCGTALMLEFSPLKGEIWSGDIDMVYLQDRAEKLNCVDGKNDFDRLARLQEIFLDVLSSRCSQCGHIKFIFNDRYEDALTPGEKEFKACIMEFEKRLESLSEESQNTRAFQYFHKSIKKMGF